MVLPRKELFSDYMTSPLSRRLRVFQRLSPPLGPLVSGWPVDDKRVSLKKELSTKSLCAFHTPRRGPND